MKKCDGDCQRMCNEYYYMTDGKFFCYDCWKRGLEHAERNSEYLHNQMLTYRQTTCDIEKLSEEIRVLRDKIRYEKEQAGTNSYFESTERYADPSYIPYNYSKVKGMERDLEMLYNRKELLENNRKSLPPNPLKILLYYKNAKWIDSTSVAYFESVILPKEIKDRNEKCREEQERQRKIEEEQRQLQEKAEREARERTRIIEEQNKIALEKISKIRNIHFRFDGINALNMKMKLFLNNIEIYVLDSCGIYDFSIPCEEEVIELKIKLSFRSAKFTLFKNQFKSDAYLRLVYNKFWGSLKFQCEGIH